jgi:hypothetical protein
MTTRLLTVSQLCQSHPAFTEASIRWHIFNAGNNGLGHSSAISRLGRKVLIDEEKFVDWAKSGATLRNAGAQP